MLVFMRKYILWSFFTIFVVNAAQQSPVAKTPACAVSITEPSV